jgi:hypothetical protein
MKSKLNITTGLIMVVLLFTLVYKLTQIPGGLIFSGALLGGILILIILAGGLLLTWLISLVFKNFRFWVFYFSLMSLSLIFFHYKIYSPTLNIRVPVGYHGEINLVKSNLKENILTIDSNGIGYLNAWTFEKVYTEPMVFDMNGKNLSEQCVGYNPTKFFSLKQYSSSEISVDIKSLSFSIFPPDKLGDKYFFGTDLSECVNLEKIDR